MWFHKTKGASYPSKLNFYFHTISNPKHATTQTSISYLKKICSPTEISPFANSTKGAGCLSRKTEQLFLELPQCELKGPSYRMLYNIPRTDYSQLSRPECAPRGNTIFTFFCVCFSVYDHPSKTLYDFNISCQGPNSLGSGLFVCFFLYFQLNYLMSAISAVSTSWLFFFLIWKGMWGGINF